MKKGFFAILLMLVLLLSGRAGAQEGVNMSAGAGLPELINLGVRIQFQQTQLGFSVGAIPEPDEDIFAVSGDFYYHFGGSSQYTSLRPWFIKTGLTYASDENEWNKITYLFLVPRVGREFNISRKFAIGLETGLFVILSENKTEKKEDLLSFWDFDLDFTGSVLPSAGINFIYRF